MESQKMEQENKENPSQVVSRPQKLKSKLLWSILGIILLFLLGFGVHNLKTTTNISKCVSNLRYNYARSGYEKGFVSVLFKDKITKEQAENILNQINPEHNMQEYTPGHLVELRVTKGSELDWKCNLEKNNNVKVVILSILPL